MNFFFGAKCHLARFKVQEIGRMETDLAMLETNLRAEVGMRRLRHFAKHGLHPENSKVNNTETGNPSFYITSTAEPCASERSSVLENPRIQGLPVNCNFS